MSTNDDPITPKTVGELNYCFFIPSYQRGYRWIKDDVEALLDDINEFSADGGETYCIQPLMVKPCDDNSGRWEVVDGQQRLTTFFIFMKIVAQQDPSAVLPFSLEYGKGRDGNEIFLEELSDEKIVGQERTTNIDYYHIVKAYETIKAWLDKQENKATAIQELNTKIRKNVSFIWYEIPSGSDSIVMFRKVNLGKIRLTNAELIKALLLNKDNFCKEGADKTQLEGVNKRQIEISLAWDRIEQGLRNDSFWYFLNEKEQSGTRIDILFEVLAETDKKRATEWEKVSTQNYSSFLFFYAWLKTEKTKNNSEKFIKDLWEQVEGLYAEFREWYEDLDKYHVIGYLIASGKSISDIVNVTRGKRKSAVWKALLEQVKNPKKLSELSHGSRNDKEKIRQVLLLFNIATFVCQEEKQHRFPFDIYKQEKWDIEHIHATADETGDADDSLENLTLLNREINRAYQDAPFNEKRDVIIKREKDGLFVPLCTRNVFLKVYSKQMNTMEEWGKWNDNDKTDYIDRIEETFEKFFNYKHEESIK